MASTNRNFGQAKVNSVPNNRENYVPGLLIGKDNLLSERRHAGRKQAFGELKNVLHNTGVTTPMKSTQKDSFNVATPLKYLSSVKGKMKIPSTVKSTTHNKKPYTEEKPQIREDNFYSENLEYIWAQQSVLSDDEINRILNGSDDDDIQPKLPNLSNLCTFEDIFPDIDEFPMPKNFCSTRQSSFADTELPSFEWTDELADF